MCERHTSVSLPAVTPRRQPNCGGATLPTLRRAACRTSPRLAATSRYRKRASLGRRARRDRCREHQPPLGCSPDAPDIAYVGVPARVYGPTADLQRVG